MSKTASYDTAPWARHYTATMAAGLPALNHASVAGMLTEAASQYRHQTAFTTCMPNGMYGSLSFAQTEDMSNAFAVYLRESLSVKPGTRVAVQMPNCLSYPVAAFAVLKAGCILVNVNPLYTPAEMEHQFNDSGAEVLVIMDMFADKLDAIMDRTPIKHVVMTSVSQWFPPVVRRVLNLVLKYWNKAIPVHHVSCTPMDQALETGRRLRDNRGIRVRDYWEPLTRDTIALLQYTGGTTGVSKGAALTHGNLLANIQQIDTMAGAHMADGQECVLTALPLYHIFAFTVNLLAFYQHGAHNVMVPSPRPIQNCQRAIENFPISWISGVNTLYNALLNEEWFNLYPPGTLKAALAGGTALHRAVAKRWQQTAGCPIAEGYGLTETSPTLCFNPLDNARPDSIGIPVPGTQIRIVDEQGDCVAPGERGEIIARGPQVMAGYWQRPEETAKSLKEGWFYTGDVAYMDPEGYFHIVDRKKDMVLVSGFNVYPNEVEDCIALLDQVQESAVIGVPDDKTGEAVRAYVVLREEGLSGMDIRQHCKRYLAAYKVPQSVEFRPDLPKTPVGKVLRKELRAQLTQEKPVAMSPGSNKDRANKDNKEKVA
ncbi:MAG: long-chain fatty acid--CoA ligase [Halomonadaceae bacterium]|nr:MAG: long-chain fatty acid--CoA ligase [Halomonadaceae bacterium]